MAAYPRARLQPENPLVRRTFALLSFLYRSEMTYFLLVVFRSDPLYHYFGGSPKTCFMRFRGSTLKTMIGVTPSMRFFHLGSRRLRFGASRSRLDVTSDDPSSGSTRVAALVTSRRDLGAPKLSRRVPRSKTGMLEMTPRLVFKVSTPKSVDMHQKSPKYVKQNEHMPKTPQTYATNHKQIIKKTKRR